MIRQEIIKQYIASLKEDGELDFIFPLLLERMGFRVLSTPLHSKGQSQYGRDVVAIKKVKSVPTLFLFELKGFAAKDITDRNLNEKDGFIESLRASKYTKFEDASIPGLANYPRQYVFVHNGYAEANVMPTLNGFIQKEFPDGNFDRWDLSKLTELFSVYLFDETILADEKCYRLFKKVLVLLDAEGNDFSDLIKLVDLLVEKIEKEKKNNRRSLLNFFATMQMIASQVYYYAKDADNLYPAKFCIDTIILKTWAWILREKQEKKKSVLKLFNFLVMLQIQIYEEYVNKILKLANFPKGLYGFTATDTENVFYPLRCYDFLADLVYYYFVIDAYGAQNDRKKIDALNVIIRNNPGCTVPLLDTHSIPILMVFKYMSFHSNTKDNVNCLGNFVVENIVNMIIRYNEQKMWPEMIGNRVALAKSLYRKSDDYCCDSSLLIMTLFELISYLGLSDIYSYLKKAVIESGVDLQWAYPLQDNFDIEQNLFEHRLNKEITVVTNLNLPDTLEEFNKTYKKKYKSIHYRTDDVNYGFLRILAHKYYETDMFPDFLSRNFCLE